jgi:hypothetical protein
LASGVDFQITEIEAKFLQADRTSEFPHGQRIKRTCRSR